MVILKKSKPKNEKELHSIIEKELNALEEGLVLLKYEFALTKGIPDFLCVDSGERLVVIEVKLQEDENILFQALRYYNEIDKDRYVIAKMFSQKDINPKDHPRIVLISEKFSDDIRRLSTLVIPDIELYEYTVLLTSEGKEGICYHAVSLPKKEEITTPKSIEKIKEYLTKDILKPLFDRILKQVKDISKNIDVYTTQDYVGFKFRGHQIGWLCPHRKSLDIAAVNIDENGHNIDFDNFRIEEGTENHIETIEKIKKSFENLEGKAK